MRKMRCKKLLNTGLCIGMILPIRFASQSLRLVKNSIILEYGQSFKADEYLDSSMDNKVISQATVDTSAFIYQKGKKYPEVGSYKVTYHYGEDSVNMNVIVKDTTAPIFDKISHTISTYKNVKPTYNKYFHVKDFSTTKLSVDDSKVKYSKAGTYKIKVKATDVYGNQKTAISYVKIKNPTLTLNKNKKTLYLKQSIKLKAIAKGKSHKITFKTSNRKVATVDSKGKIIAKKKGIAIITVSANGIKKSCKITVKNPMISLMKSKTIYTQKTYSLNAKIYGYSQKATYQSSDKRIATVSKTGKITGKKKGKCIITVKANGITKRCKITVKTLTKDVRLKMAKTEAKKVVKKIIKPGMSQYQKAKAICIYLYDHVGYCEQGVEAYKKNFGNEAYGALVKKGAACSGFSRAVVLLCNEAKIPVKHINPNQWIHQWNEVKIKGKWIMLDAMGAVFDGKSYSGTYVGAYYGKKYAKRMLGIDTPDGYVWFAPSPR